LLLIDVTVGPVCLVPFHIQ